MTEILKYIELGTSLKEYFNYDGSPLPIRPLSSWEYDEAFKMAIREGVSSFIFDAVIQVKLNMIKPEDRVDLGKDFYINFLDYYNQIDYWVVYYAMKDFQPEEFSLPDYDKEFINEYDDWSQYWPKGIYIVRKMKYVHKIAEDVQKMTNQPDAQLVEVLTNNEGKTLATMVHRFHTPLVSEAWKLTPLQSKFMYYSRPGAPEMLKSEEDLPGITGGTLEEISKQLAKMGIS
jgi:hypothetical protein